MINPSVRDLIELSNVSPWVSGPGLFNPHAYPYYSFFFRLTQLMRPDLVIELGTDAGDSACHFAAGSHMSKVVTIGMPHSDFVIERIKPFRNIDAIFGWTHDPDILARAKDYGRADILLIDTLHTSDQANYEYQNYGALVRPGGLIICDDIDLHDDMRAFWNGIEGDKVSLPHLHDTGFGVVIKA